MRTCEAEPQCGNKPRHSERKHISSCLSSWVYRLINSPRSSPVMQFFLINVVGALAISLFLYLLVVFSDHRKRGGLPYPPGPLRRPIIGNLLDVPKNAPWIAYSNMSKKYGRHTILRNWLAPAEARAKAMLFVFAFFLRSSSSCVRYQLSRISLKSAGKYTQIGLTYQS